MGLKSMKKFKKNIIFQIRMFLSNDRASLIKKSRIFHKIGENCRWQPYTIPSEPYLISLGNNVRVTAGVRFVTHDITPALFCCAGYKMNKECLYYMDKIIIGNNVMIGADSIILPGIIVGDNVIIAAGSVVSKNLESGFIYAGVPAKKIGKFDDLANKRMIQTLNRPNHLSSIEEINKYFWE